MAQVTIHGARRWHARIAPELSEAGARAELEELARTIPPGTRYMAYARRGVAYLLALADDRVLTAMRIGRDG